MYCFGDFKCWKVLLLWWDWDQNPRTILVTKMPFAHLFCFKSKKITSSVQSPHRQKGFWSWQEIHQNAPSLPFWLLKCRPDTLQTFVRCTLVTFRKTRRCYAEDRIIFGKLWTKQRFTSANQIHFHIQFFLENISPNPLIIKMGIVVLFREIVMIFNTW